MKGGAFHKNKSKTVLPFCFFSLQKQSTANVFEVFYFFVYFRFLDLEVFCKASLAKKLICIAVNKPSVYGYFIAIQELFAFFTAGHIKALLS